MFTSTEDGEANQSASINQADIAEHIQRIFHSAKAIRPKIDELKQQKGSRHYIHGLGNLTDQYQQYLDSLDVDFELRELYQAIIAQQKAEAESRLSGLQQYQTSLKQAIQQHDESQSELENQSYTEILAAGDVEAAEAMEAEKQAKLTDNAKAKQDAENKLAATQKAAKLLGTEVSVYSDLLGKANHNLCEKRYHEHKQGFDERFEALKEEYLEMEKLAALLWGNDQLLKTRLGAPHRLRVKQLLSPNASPTDKIY